MNPGQLDKRITLQRPGGSRDVLGERTTTWTDVATVWARIRPLSTREAAIAGQQQSSASHAVEIRHSSIVASIDAAWRVKFGTRVLVIDGVINIEEKNDKLILYCTEGLRSE